MDWVAIVSASAAGLAAVLAGVNLYISGRRELDKWTRETLLETLAAFLDGSFKYADACRTICRLSPQVQDINKLRRAILAAHGAETEALTRLRILAPPSVVEAALKLFEAEYHLAEPCFLDPVSTNLSIDTYYMLVRPVRQRRAQFIEATRAALGLHRISGTGSFEANVSWSTLRRLLDEAEIELPSIPAQQEETSDG